MTEAKEEKEENVVLDYRCQRCGAPYTRQTKLVDCELELGEYEGSFHPCNDEGVGIGKLVGFHPQK